MATVTTWIFAPEGTTVRYTNCDQWVTGILTDYGWGSYSTGGWTTAPVAQPVPAAPPTPKPDRPTEYATVRDAADAVCGYACARSHEQPRFYVFKVLSQERPVTVDWLEREIVEANGRRQTKLDLAQLRVNLRGWDLTGLTFLVEGWELR